MFSGWEGTSERALTQKWTRSHRVSQSVSSQTIKTRLSIVATLSLPALHFQSLSRRRFLRFSAPFLFASAARACVRAFVHFIHCVHFVRSFVRSFVHCRSLSFTHSIVAKSWEVLPSVRSFVRSFGVFASLRRVSHWLPFALPPLSANTVCHFLRAPLFTAPPSSLLRPSLRASVPKPPACFALHGDATTHAVRVGKQHSDGRQHGDGVKRGMREHGRQLAACVCGVFIGAGCAPHGVDIC